VTCSSGSASITWGTGVPRPRRVTVIETEIVRPGDPLPQPPRADARHDTELLGGRLAEVSEMHFPDLHHTEARWREPAVYLQGEARSRTTVELLLAIQRTVRFLPEQSPP
jgi:hypothetical protein